VLREGCQTAMGKEPVSDKRYADFVKENASLWRQAWNGNFGDNAVLRTTERWDNMVEHLGYVSVSVQWNVRDTLATVITTDEDLVKASQERLGGVKIVPDERLTTRQSAHLKLARAIANRIFTIHKVDGVYAAIIPPASDRVRTAGMYSREAREIYISIDQLEHGQSTVDTVIHEMAHHMSGAEDLEEPHSAAMTKLAALVVKHTTQGVFDELMPEVKW